MRVLNTAQMREADRRTIEDVGIPAIVLMENAGREAAAAIETAFDDIATFRIAILCGPGNNGGDGFVVARALAARGADVDVYVIGGAAASTGDARANLRVLQRMDVVEIIEIANAAAWKVEGPDALSADVIVDAMFGTGVRVPLTGLYETIVADVNMVGNPVVSIDLPSGLSADTPEVPGPAIHASMTVTLGAPKLPLVLPPAATSAGEMIVADIGIPAAIVDALDGPRVEVITRHDVRLLVVPRAADSHKGDYGRILIVAGSRGLTGSASLCARAALRSGAGLVTVATPASSAPVVASLGAEYMTLPLDEAPDGTVAASALDRLLAFKADVIAVGPGLGRTASAAAVVHGLVARSSVPLVLDADALIAFAGNADRLVGRDGIDIVVTPHPGEMAALTGQSIDDVQADRLEVARSFASAHRVHVILKGHRTLVASPDGAVAINTTGNPGMATAGAGDVLTGMVAAWLAQRRDAGDAARLAVYLHGLAGDLVAVDRGQVALVAGDLVDRLGAAVLDLTGASPKKSGALGDDR
ncbi:MAG TPA: NAD(P)H-hydrate dehydratase [Vicinamibacterales bacterium]|jgi:NAD(P)H-hydrate epimerase|nr:NAD(P)H-hydrate dehydratase [Vicinamibacterales bacterium]